MEDCVRRFDRLQEDRPLSPTMGIGGGPLSCTVTCRAKERTNRGFQTVSHEAKGRGVTELPVAKCHSKNSCPFVEPMVVRSYFNWSQPPLEAAAVDVG